MSFFQKWVSSIIRKVFFGVSNERDIFENTIPSLVVPALLITKPQLTFQVGTIILDSPNLDHGWQKSHNGHDKQPLIWWTKTNMDRCLGMSTQPQVLLVHQGWSQPCSALSCCHLLTNSDVQTYICIIDSILLGKRLLVVYISTLNSRRFYSRFLKVKRAEHAHTSLILQLS